MIDVKFDRLYLEITNTCNLACSFCAPHQRPNRMMRVDEFEHILSEVSPFGDHVYFHVKGEPTLHPNLEHFLNLAHQAHKKVHLVTNGTRLGQLDFDLGAHPALASLVISLHSLQTLPQSTQEAILGDLSRFLDHNRQRALTLYLRLWNENNGALIAWLSKYVGFPVTYSPSKKRQPLIDNLVLETDQAFDWPDIDHPKVTDHGTCYGGLKMMTVLGDGTVTPCCLDHNAQLALGNLFETPLADILSSQRYQTFTSNLRNGKLNEDLCQRCTYHLKHKKRISV
jgi:radical SAM protein with 4Fe4S-binding SPASM domain